MSTPASRTETVHSSRPAGGKRRLKTLLLVSGLLITAFVAFISHEWGATWHSIIGIGALGVVAWHVYTQRRWIRSAAARRTSHPETKLVIFNPVLALTFAVVVVSGVPVWLWAAGGVVAQVHDITGAVFLPLVLVHLFLNRRRVAAGLRRARPSS